MRFMADCPLERRSTHLQVRDLRPSGATDGTVGLRVRVRIPEMEAYGSHDEKNTQPGGASRMQPLCSLWSSSSSSLRCGKTASQ